VLETVNIKRTSLIKRMMIKQVYSIILFWVLFLQVQFAKGQLIVSNALTPQQLAQLISGQGVKILNPVVHCGVNGYGKYNATSSNLNISEGLLLTSGTIYNAVGPNNVGNKTTFFGAQNTPSTYTLLNNYTGKTTWEYCEFEFDIIPQGDTIKFDFVFASEEYEEWVGSQYNDVFGFFISGPGITGDPGVGIYHNIALLPSSTTAVTINNVNQNINTTYYHNNNNGASVQYDGFTRGLKAISKVTPCNTYHLKLVVADVSDKLWDSGVFIEKISSNIITLSSQTVAGIPNMIEGCNNGTVIFTRPVASSNPLTIKYWLGGSATNGTDYPLIGSSSLPSNPKTIVIPANQVSAYLNINPIADGLNEGTEFLTVYLGNPLCADQIMDSLRFYIQDSLFTTVVPVSDSICLGQNKQITATGGGSSFSWLPATGLNNSSISNPIATPSTTTIYTMTTTASACVMKRTSKINVSNILLSFSPTNVSCNGANNGSVNLTVSGGFPPYSYSWTGPSSYTANTQNISGLVPGTYTVNVIGKKACTTTGTVTITQPAVMTATVTSPAVNGGYNIACFAGNNGSASASASGGTVSYTYSWTTVPTQTTSTASNLTAGTYSVTIKDAHNCMLVKTITLTQPTLLTSTITAQTNVLCYANTTGGATVTPSGGNAPYTYVWTTSPAQSNAVATNLGAGTYTVIIKDANNCSTTTGITISQPGAALSANITSQTNVFCYGNTTGSASVTATGGAGTYTYFWNTTPPQTNAAAVNLGAGSYVVTVKDANNCMITIPLTITQPAANVNASISPPTNVSCFGGNNGSATVNATGGVPGYTYSWNTTPVQTTATAINLSAGTYNVVVKDANNCSYNIPANITQPASLLTATVTSQNNVLCFGNNSASATASGGGGTPIYSYSWNSSPVQTTATATNLVAGTYTVTIKDFNNCSTTKTITITQPTTAVSASITTHTNVLCFGANTGAAGVTASGGTGGYTYNWNSAPIQTTAIATDLAAGNYTVTVKDANNCSVLTSVTIIQPPSILSVSITSITNVLCKGNATGSATVSATGGSGSYSYSWNSTPTQTTAIASGLTIGNYTVTISDNNGCAVPIKLPVTITEPAALLNASSTSPLFNGNNISCFGGNNGSINLTPSGGTPVYTYSWSGPLSFSSASEDISGLSAGTYSVVITDSHGCTKNYSATLTAPTVLSTVVTVTPATCPTINDGALNLTASGGTGSYSYAWSGPGSFTAITQNISSLVSGNYTVTVTDASACSKTVVYTVTQPGAIIITNNVSSYTGGNNISCYGYNNGNINSVTISGGTPVYNYSWTGPNSFTATTANISSLYAGNYQLVVSDIAGCVANKLITLTEPAAITSTLTPGVFAGGYNVSCSGASTGNVNSISMGGTPGYSYSWNGPSGYISTNQNISGLAAGIYTLTIHDVNTCVGIHTITLTQPALLTTNIFSPAVNGGYNITCRGLSTGAINLNTSGGAMPYSYLWTGPLSYSSSTQNLTGLAAGNYSVVVRDTNGCISTNTITLTEPNNLVASATSPTVVGGYNITCNGQTNGSINLNVIGGATAYNYSWTGTGAHTSSVQNPTGISAGTYSVLVTDANGCIATTAIILTQPDAFTSYATSPTVTGGNNITCNGASTGSINLTVNGGTTNYSYSWTGPASYTSAIQNPSSLEAGAYNVTAIDANGCITTSAITLTEPSPLLVNISSPTYAGGYNITCNGLSNGSLNLSADGGTPTYSYSWSGPLSYSSTIQNPSGIIAGTYNVNVTDINGCVTPSAITVIQPILITGSLSTSTYNGGYNVSCNGATNGNVLQTISGGTMPFTNIWSNGITTQNLSNVGAGTYSVIVTDANNCFITQNITLTEPTQLFASAVSPSYYGGYNIKCYGNTTGDINLGVSGGTSPYAYNWNGPSTYTATTQNISNIGAGTYSVVVTDLNNCKDTSIIILTQPTALTSSITASSNYNGYNVSCFGLSDGSLSLTVNGGVTAYSYNWSNGNTSQNLSSIGAGTFSVIISDANNCTNTSQITLTQPTDLVSTVVSLSNYNGYNISCTGLTNGNIDINVTGGVTTYSYIWSNATSTQDQTNIGAGIYSVVVTDLNNCNDTSIITLTQPTALTSSITASSNYNSYNISCFGLSDGSLSLTVNGGVTTYSYNWSNGNTSQNLSSLGAGTYSVVVTDINNCKDTSQIILTQPTDLVSTVVSVSNYNGYNISCNGLTDGNIDINVTGGVTTYSYTWSNATTTQDQTNIGAGIYSVVVTDLNNCNDTSIITLTQPTALTSSITASSNYNGYNISCFGLSDGSLSLTVNGGVTAYSYNWSSGSTSQNLSSLGAGTYSVTITDQNNCKNISQVILTQPPEFVTSVVSLSDYHGYNISCDDFTDGSIDINVTGGLTPYSYAWSNNTSTQDQTNLSEGTYSVVIVDANNCKNTLNIALTDPSDLITNGNITSNYNGYSVSCYGSNNGMININATGSVPSYTYSWSNGSSSQNQSALSAGTYSVVISDQNACSDTLHFVMTQPDSISVAPTIKNVLCTIFHNGSIDLTVTGGVNPFTYNWSNGTTGQNISGIGIGTYTVALSDINSCPSLHIYNIIETSPVIISLSHMDVNCFGQQDGSIVCNVLGGIPSFVYQWSNGSNQPQLTNVGPGTYIVTVSDSNTCSKTDTVLVIEPNQLSSSLNSPVMSNGHNVSFHHSSDGSVTTTISGGTSPYTFSWSNGSTAQNLTNVSAGTYTLLVTDKNGCTLTAFVTLTQPSELAMPTGISPNGDGLNDYFVVHGIEAYPDNAINIFNRWGDIIYDKDKYANTWAGKSNAGVDLPDGTYFVILKINNGNITLTGYVDVRR